MRFLSFLVKTNWTPCRPDAEHLAPVLLQRETCPTFIRMKGSDSVDDVLPLLRCDGTKLVAVETHVDAYIVLLTIAGMAVAWFVAKRITRWARRRKNEREFERNGFITF